jgi:hypothetical protein
LEFYLQHWCRELGQRWRAHASIVDRLAVSALVALSAALLFA